MSDTLTQNTIRDDLIKIAKDVIGCDPFIDDSYGGLYCFFCSHDDPDHEDNCTYLLAKKIADSIKDASYA